MLMVLTQNILSHQFARQLLSRMSGRRHACLRRELRSNARWRLFLRTVCHRHSDVGLSVHGARPKRAGQTVRGVSRVSGVSFSPYYLDCQSDKLISDDGNVSVIPPIPLLKSLRSTIGSLLWSSRDSRTGGSPLQHLYCPVAKAQVIVGPHFASYYW
jgi:hypothetical protein